MLEARLAQSPAIDISPRKQNEEYVGSSFQFRPRLREQGIGPLIESCLARGVDIKWFGAAQPKAFTSRYDSWRYLGDLPTLPKTLQVLSRTCDIRVPLTFDLDDCRLIAEIIAEEAERLEKEFNLN